MPSLLIINADDYGLDPLVNEAIRELLSTKKISQTTLLINGINIASEIEPLLAIASPSQIGLHFNITHGQSLGKNYKTLTNAQNHFFPKNQCYDLLENGKIDLQEIQEECFLQLTALKQFVPSMTHLDSHHHIHLFPNIFKILAPVLKAEGIKTIRLPLEINSKTNLYSEKAKQIFEEVNAFGFYHCPYFFGLNLIGNPSFEIVESLRKLFESQSKKNTAVEWMVHPGKRGSYFYGSSKLSPEAREREFTFLKSEILMQHFPIEQYPRGTYHDLLHFLSR